MMEYEKKMQEIRDRNEDKMRKEREKEERRQHELFLQAKE